MQTISTKFSKPVKSFKFEKAQCDFIFSADVVFDKIFSLRPWFDASIESQFNKKNKDQKNLDLKKAIESDWVDPLSVPEFKSMNLNFSEGGSAVAFLLPKAGFDTFELHTALRKTFASFFTEGAEQTYRIEFVKIKSPWVFKIIEAFGHFSESGAWKATAFGKKSETPRKASSHAFEFVSELPSAQLKAAFELGQVKGRAVNHVRTLAELPANELNPKGYRAHLTRVAKDEGLKFEFLDTKALKKMGAGGFLSVVQADPDTYSGIAKLSYKPAKKAKKKLALVGKGLCFDTGGYNIKTGSYMHGMHGDMTGSAVALATLQAIKELRLDIEVTAYLAIAENLISPTAFKPNEVVVASNGMSIEVVDTDAEGRMVLSDTLAIASEAKPDLILDYATLTGSVIRALDQRRSGIYSNVESMIESAQRSGVDSGERVWGFPIGRDYFEPLKSSIADIKQCNTAVNSDHIYAASFLARFVGPGIPWVHMDLAASEHKGGLGLISTDTTGFGVGWSLAFIEQWL